MIDKKCRYFYTLVFTIRDGQTRMTLPFVYLSEEKIEQYRYDVIYFNDKIDHARNIDSSVKVLAIINERQIFSHGSSHMSEVQDLYLEFSSINEAVAYDFAYPVDDEVHFEPYLG